MFARLSAAILLALPLLALAACDTANQQCCNSVEQSNTPSVANLLSIVGADAQGDTAQVGGMFASLIVK
ncbi:hypothetical protein C0991_007342 [Blastosporella zonata]|nr:hypothetical protein C0991_007342 [Blastosporella zonata]